MCSRLWREQRPNFGALVRIVPLGGSGFQVVVLPFPPLLSLGDCSAAADSSLRSCGTICRPVTGRRRSTRLFTVIGASAKGTWTGFRAVRRSRGVLRMGLMGPMRRSPISLIGLISPIRCYYKGRSSLPACPYAYAPQSPSCPPKIAFFHTSRIADRHQIKVEDMFYAHVSLAPRPVGYSGNAAGIFPNRNTKSGRFGNPEKTVA